MNTDLLREASLEFSVEHGTSSQKGPAPHQTTTALRIQVLKSFEGAELLQGKWDEVVAANGGPVYLTWHWVRTWWSVYCEKRALRILLFWSGEELVGVLPMYLERFGISPLSARIARIVGANIPPKCFNPPICPARADQILAMAVEHLLSVERCDLVSLGPVSLKWPCVWKLKSSAATSCAGLTLDYVPRDVVTVFDLPGKFEDYLASLDSGERTNRRRRLRQLEKLGAVSTDIVSSPLEVEREFERFAEHHREQWKVLGKGGHFISWPRGLEFHRALVRQQGLLGRVRFFRLLLNGEVIANRYAYAFGETIYSELPSRNVGAPWDKLGLGGTAYLKFFEAAIDLGFHRIDTGLGTYDNKLQLGGSSIEVGTWRITRMGASRLRSRIFLLGASILQVVFHKGFYRRIAPRLPGGVGRTQAFGWLRYDA